MHRLRLAARAEQRTRTPEGNPPHAANLCYNISRPPIEEAGMKTMKAWRFHAFKDMRLEDVPVPECRPGHVLVEPLCVQPSVTEAQLAQDIPTLAYDRIKRRLETDAPLQLF